MEVNLFLIELNKRIEHFLKDFAYKLQTPFYFMILLTKSGRTL